MAKEKSIELELVLPQKAEAKKENKTLVVKGPKGEVRRTIAEPLLSFDIKDGKVLLSTKSSTKSEKKLIYSYEEHIKNMLKGVIDGHPYVLKICSGHFPMAVSIANNQLIVKNFLGEKFPRTLALKKGVAVKVEGDKVNVDSADKELAGTTASDIENLTRRPGFDTRIFQDGLYMIIKDGKEIK